MQSLTRIQNQLKEIREQFQKGIPSDQPSSQNLVNGLAAVIFGKRFNVYKMTLLDIICFKLKEKQNEVAKIQRSLKRMNIFQSPKSLNWSYLFKGFQLHPQWPQRCIFMASILKSSISDDMFQEGRFKSLEEIDLLGLDRRFNLRRIIAEINQELQKHDIHFRDLDILRAVYKQIKGGKFKIPIYFTLSGQTRLRKINFINAKLQAKHSLQSEIKDLQTQFNQEKRKMIQFAQFTRNQLRSRPINMTRPQLLAQENEMLPEENVIEISESQVSIPPVERPFRIPCKSRAIPSSKCSAKVTSERREMRKQMKQMNQMKQMKQKAHE